MPKLSKQFHQSSTMKPHSTSKISHQIRRKENGKRKKNRQQNKGKGSHWAKAKTVSTTDNQTSQVLTEFDEIERLCLPNYKFVQTTPGGIQQNYPEHYDVGKYLTLSNADRRQYRNSNDLRKNLQNDPDESDWTDYPEHRLCQKQLRGQKCENSMCSFKHGFRLPRKLRLCSEWMMKGACADGDDCLYLHSEFPCRFHYLGLRSLRHDAKTCRFYHGGPLPQEYENMFLDSVDSKKFPMFREMYSKRLRQLQAATTEDTSVVGRKEDIISSHGSAEQQQPEIDQSSITAVDSGIEQSVDIVAPQKVNGSEACQQKGDDSSDDERSLHIADDDTLN